VAYEHSEALLNHLPGGYRRSTTVVLDRLRSWSPVKDEWGRGRSACCGSGAQVGDDPFERAPAPCAHGWAAVDVVSDRTEGLLEGPGLSSLPFRVIAADVISE
jgi:hypothetical protein